MRRSCWNSTRLHLNPEVMYHNYVQRNRIPLHHLERYVEVLTQLTRKYRLQPEPMMTPARIRALAKRIVNSTE
jgi:hypothetical protein